MPYLKEHDWEIGVDYSVKVMAAPPTTDVMRGIIFQVCCNGPCDILVSGSLDNKIWNDLVSSSIEIEYFPPDGDTCKTESTFIPLAGELALYRYYRVGVKVSNQLPDIKTKKIVTWVSGNII